MVGDIQKCSYEFRLLSNTLSNGVAVVRGFYMYLIRPRVNNQIRGGVDLCTFYVSQRKYYSKYYSKAIYYCTIRNKNI